MYEKKKSKVCWLLSVAHDFMFFIILKKHVPELPQIIQKWDQKYNLMKDKSGTALVSLYALHPVHALAIYKIEKDFENFLFPLKTCSTVLTKQNLADKKCRHCFARLENYMCPHVSFFLFLFMFLYFFCFFFF